LLYIVLGVVLGIIVFAGIWEYQLHLRNLAKVPIRIHVNGTRGKSSVTRLITAGLRAGGMAACAKTTGSAPCMILEDGSEYTIQRQGRANIIEQARAISVAARRNAKVAVLECMALNPRYQAFCEEVLVRSTVGVITNVRADHLDVMGPTVGDVAKALAGTTPKAGRLVTAETNESLLNILVQSAQQHHTEFIQATGENQQVTDEEMRGFSYIEHPDNVALSLKVCSLLGVARTQALKGMVEARPDIGVLRVIHLAFYAKNIDFINAFAANDPDSTMAIWERILRLFPGSLQRVLLLNCRSDRTQRSVQLGELLPQLKQVDHALITGTGTRAAVDAALEKGFDPEKMIIMENNRVDEVFERTVAQIPHTGLVYGIGNIGGLGHSIVEYFQNRATMPETVKLGE
jgi:gamma-polyglutamate synthase